MIRPTELPRLGTQGHRFFSVRPRALAARSACRISVAAVCCALSAVGCSTTLGYVPHDIYVGMDKQTPETSVPNYQAVKEWVVQVSDGYDSRSTANRQAIYGGALIAAAGAGALVGLAAFAPGSSAI